MSEALLPNSTISHYRIVSKIGAGGMGEVYRAHDSRLDREVAIKLLPANFATDVDRLKRFEQEARATSALNHPNILTVYDIGTHEGSPYIVAELLEGEELRDRLDRGPIPPRKAIDYAQQIVNGLSAVHEKGIVHRDLKPENLFITRDERVKILDFGLAKLRDTSVEGQGSEDATRKAITNSGMVMGTVGYMSPEQVRGQPIDHRSDIFSFGAILHEMITGGRAFRRETMAETMTAILREEPEELSQTNPTINPSLERIVHRCLEKKPERRFQSAHDLSFALESLSAPTSSSGSGLPYATNEAIGRHTRLTTGLSAQPLAKTSSELTKPERRRVVIAVIALVTLATAVGGYFYYSGRNKSVINSIAVMPFVNESGNADVEYLSDGMTETLISSLSQLPNLSVKARSTVFRYKGKDANPKAIGKDLNVQAILNGRVVQRGDQITVSLELVNAQTENVIWSGQYSRKQTDLISLQSELARDVSSKLRTKLSGADDAKLAKTYTTNLEAYQLYLKGRFYWNQRTGESLKKAIGYFNQAIEKDPTYALAFAGLAEAYVVLPNFSASSPHDSAPKAKAAAQRALELDETLAEAHTALAYVLLNYYWDYPAANRAFQRAIELNPNYATAHQWYGNGYLLAIVARFDEAIAEGKRAQELDPLSLIVNSDLGQDYFFARQYEKAIEQLRKTVEIDQSFYNAHDNLGMAYEMKGSFQEALAEYRRARELSDDPFVLARLGHALAASGQRDEALQTLDQLKESSTRRYVPAYAFTILYAGLGEKEQALQWLEKSYQDREPKLTRLKVDPLLDPLRSDPRFKAMLKRVNLPE